MNTPREVIENLFKVETKTPGLDGARIIPFKLNAAQQVLDDATKLKQMHLILKARQLGFSTYVEARFLAKCLTVKGTHAVVVSHEHKATMRLLRRVHFFMDNLEEGEAVAPTEFSSKCEITFPKTMSSFYLGTAGQRAFSRGDMVTDFHGSEIAYWPDPETLMSGVMGALTNDAEVFLESTGNGMGGYFFDLCKGAMDAIEKGTIAEYPYDFLFFPWTLAPEYTRPVKGAQLWTPEEGWLQRKYKLSFEQLVWRRWKMSQYRSPEAFYQEFPLTPEEAFIVSGTCYFDKTAIRLYQRNVKEPIARGMVELIGEKAQFLRYGEGKLRMWEYPRPMVEYLISADCAEGIESEGTDFTYASVMNRERFCQAAALHGKIPPDEMGIMLYALGKFYQWPWIAVEDNGPGLACLLKLKELGYPKIYKMRRYDTEKQQEVDKIGWHTDERTRPLILSEISKVVRQQVYGIFEQELLNECTTFCKQKSGKYEHNSGCHDDRVLAHAIGVYLHKMLPYRPEEDYGNRVEGRQVQVQHAYKTGY